LQICLDEVFACDCEAARQSINFLFTECWLHFPAAVGALSAIDSLPHSLRNGKDPAVEFLPIGIIFQKAAESPVLVLFLFGQRAYLKKIVRHGCILIAQHGLMKQSAVASCRQEDCYLCFAIYNQIWAHSVAPEKPEKGNRKDLLTDSERSRNEAQRSSTRVFAISDLHVDHTENARWLAQLSTWDYRQDALICAGDIGHQLNDVAGALNALKERFRFVIYVPGNHELWVRPENGNDSLRKFAAVRQLARDCGVHVGPLHLDKVSLVPVLAWYDYSFGTPSEELLERWADYQTCSWPKAFDQARITSHFLAANEVFIPQEGRQVITFSHFVPRSDLLPAFSGAVNLLRPVLGSNAIDVHIRKLHSSIHIYGHYHVNSQMHLDGVLYINNALGYPREHTISARQLIRVVEG
jgi:predicted phosphodiesterase